MVPYKSLPVAESRMETLTGINDIIVLIVRKGKQRIKTTSYEHPE
jgi:hypothetical protein